MLNIFTVTFLLAFRPAASMDTIIVHDSVDVSLPGEMIDRMFYPKRTFISSKTDASLSIDSIRVGNTIIDECGKDYYLVVYDQKGKKRLEGNFFDQYPKGFVVEYNEDGKKFAEGNYKVIYSIKPVTTFGNRSLHYFSEKNGTWRYFDAHGRKNKEVDFGADGKILATRYYNPKGKLVRSE